MDLHVSSPSECIWQYLHNQFAFFFSDTCVGVSYLYISVIQRYKPGERYRQTSQACICVGNNIYFFKRLSLLKCSREFTFLEQLYDLNLKGITCIILCHSLQSPYNLINCAFIFAIKGFMKVFNITSECKIPGIRSTITLSKYIKFVVEDVGCIERNDFGIT